LVLASSESTRSSVPAPDEAIEHISPSVSLPDLVLAAMKPASQGEAIDFSQARAVFFRDGSGSAVTIRAQFGSATPSMRFSARYYAPVRADGSRAWRDSVVEVDSAVSANIGELEDRDACPATETCARHGPLLTQTGQHLIRWNKQLIAGVPPSLMAEMSPPAAAATAAAAQAGATSTAGATAPVPTDPPIAPVSENPSGH
jgi:hypothetical protein